MESSNGSATFFAQTPAMQQRLACVKEISDIPLDLPAGVAPYEDFDFEPYCEEARHEEDLRKTWRVFTKVKDVLDNGRRLENASWRLWYKERSKAAPSRDMEQAAMSSLEQYDMSFDDNLRRAEEETDRMVGDMFGGMGNRFQQETEKGVERAKVDRTKALLDLAQKHSLSPEAVDDVIAWMRAAVHTSGEDARPDRVDDFIPSSFSSAREFLNESARMKRPRVAAFSHSLVRTGCNNFLLYLVRELREDFSFELISPKEGPMRADYEAIDVPVRVCNIRKTTYPEDLRRIVSNFNYAIANSIVSSEVVHAAADSNVPVLWVIHEAWPRDEFDFYAREVFKMLQLNEELIASAFAKASRIVFPSHAQRRCYAGMLEESKSKVIYNGLPLASINAFRATQSRKQIRKELGYDENDVLLVQIGTVCRRKAQLITCQVFAELFSTVHLQNGKRIRLLIVGARFSREHEREYIEECRQTLEAVGAENAASIIGMKKNVSPFYLAADLVLYPSLNEMLPVGLCEAMAFGQPVVASNVDGIPEAVKDRVEGLLVEAGNAAALYDAVERLALDTQLRTTMGAAARERVLNQFNIATMSKAYQDVMALDLGSDAGCS